MTDTQTRTTIRYALAIVLGALVAGATVAQASLTSGLAIDWAAVGAVALGAVITGITTSGLPSLRPATSERLADRILVLGPDEMRALNDEIEERRRTMGIS